jgi:hypothetical protein
MVDEPNNYGLKCVLEPVGEKLRGVVEAPASFAADGEKPKPEPGHTVRLDDDSWPESSQRFVLGRVETVAADPASPLRTIITVVPTVKVEIVSEVTLRIASDSAKGATP